MVTDVAFVACQVNVTICPAVIAFVLAEKIIVGVPEVWGSRAGDPPPQLMKKVARVNGKKVRTCRARERVRIAASQVRASFGAGLGCSRFTKGCMSTHGERGGNACKRRDPGVPLRPHGSKRGETAANPHVLPRLRTSEYRRPHFSLGRNTAILVFSCQSFTTIVFEPRIPSLASAGFLRLSFTGQ